MLKQPSMPPHFSFLFLFPLQPPFLFSQSNFKRLIYTHTHMHTHKLSLHFILQSTKIWFPHFVSLPPLFKFNSDLLHNHHWLFQVSSFWHFLLYFILVIKFLEILSSSGFQDIAVSQISFCLCYYY